MIYNHKRLKEVTKLTIYPEGKMMLVWDIEKPEFVMKRKVFAVLCDPAGHSVSGLWLEYRR